MVAKTEYEARLNIALEEIRDELALQAAISGENGFVESIVLRLADFGAAATDTYIAGRAGLRGRVMGIRVHSVTETFATDGLDALVSVGTTSSDALTSETNPLPTSDIDYYAQSVTVPDGAAAATPPTMAAFTFSNYIPAGVGFNITKALATDSGTVAGIGTVTVTIAWMATES